MKSYISYKNQIQGVKDISETVKAVEKIAASSVHVLRQETTGLTAYATHVEQILARLSLFYEKKDHPLLQERKTGEKAIIMLTGNKGLVGGLWHKMINTCMECFNQYASVITIGTKGEHYLKEERVAIAQAFEQVTEGFSQEEVKPIAGYIFDEYRKGTFARVDILYPQFISLTEQVPKLIPFLPFVFTLTPEQRAEGGMPIFTTSKQKIFGELLQKYIEVFFYKIIMETKLSELAARTVAMEQAALKTDELSDKLSLDYTKARHRVATQRQLESFVTHKIL